MKRFSDSKQPSIHSFFSKTIRSSADGGGGGSGESGSGGVSGGGGENSASRIEDVTNDTGASAATKGANGVY